MDTIEECSCESHVCYRTDFFESFSELVVSGNTTKRKEKVGEANKLYATELVQYTALNKTTNRVLWPCNNGKLLKYTLLQWIGFVFNVGFCVNL